VKKHIFPILSMGICALLMALTVYSYPTCGSCRKAKKFFEEHGLSFVEHHIVKEPPTSRELKELIEKSQLPMKKFFNTSGKKYRELGLSKKLKEMTEEEQFQVLTSDPMLLKRPIVTDGDKVTVGFREEDFRKQWLS
jgi:arsenate reductase